MLLKTSKTSQIKEVELMYNLWDDRLPFPEYCEMRTIKDINYVNIHTAVEGEYQFLLGAAIVKHNEMLYASWANSFRNENDDNTILAQKISCDGGLTWTDYKKISKTDIGFGRSHGVYFRHEDKLYILCPKARYDETDAYPELKMEEYVLNDGEWENLGIVLDDYFWPMCEPIKSDNGTLIMAGLKTNTAEAAVALCDGKDITKWEMKVLPNPDGMEYWGETTVLKQNNKLIALARGGLNAECILVSESYDNGNSWSGLEKSNFPISNSKLYAGTLSNGINYIVFNAKSEKYRETLCIATGRESFDKVYVIRHGFDCLPRFWNTNEWCYPYACEADGNLYVVYAKNKEDCELAIIPLDSID